MTTCDGFQEMAERRLHGALGASESAALDAHLVGCGECSEFVRFAALSEEALRGRTLEPSGGAAGGDDGARWHEGFRSRLDRDRRRFGKGALVVAAVTLLHGWSRGWAGAAFIGTVGAIMLVLGWLLVARPRWRRARAVLDSGGDLLATYREDLDREIGVRRQSRTWFRVLAVLWGAVLVMQPVVLWKQHAFGEPLDFRGAAFTALMGAWLVGSMLWSLRVTLPRLERERAEIDA